MPVRLTIASGLRRAKDVSEESDRMMVLLQELSALKKAGAGKSGEGLIPKKRRKEITEEMKQLAVQKKKHSQ